MIPTIDATGFIRDATDLNNKLAGGIRNLSTIKDAQVEIAGTPKNEMFRTDKVTLYRYRPLGKPALSTPVLLVYSLIGRHTMTDLQDDRSLVRNLLEQGLDVWVVDWGNATRADRWLTIDDYVLGYLDDCVREMCKTAAVDKVDLLGICEGGVFTLAYAALEPTRVKNLMLTITPLDFHADAASGRPDHGLINVWMRSLKGEDIDQMIELSGVLPGEFMSAGFSMLTPARSLAKYNIDLLEVIDDEVKLLNFLRMEKWLSDRPDHPGEAAKQWLKDLYQNNRLINNTWALGGRKVDLGRVTMPVLNIFAQNDHIIPPETTSGALADKLGSDDYTELSVPGGHIGLFVSKKSQGIVGGGIGDWLRRRAG